MPVFIFYLYENEIEYQMHVTPFTTAVYISQIPGGIQWLINFYLFNLYFHEYEVNFCPFILKLRPGNKLILTYYGSEPVIDEALVR